MHLNGADVIFCLFLLNLGALTVALPVNVTTQLEIFETEIKQLKKDYARLESEQAKLLNGIESLNQYCNISGEGKCGPCRCRDDHTISAKYYCDCQNLTPLRDCKAFYESGVRINGMYKINLNNMKLIQIYCDMTTDGGGWSVIQRRVDGSVNFYRNWNSYKVGFGSLTNEFWLGNDDISLLSLQAFPARSEMRVDMENWYGIKKFAKYSDFQLGDEHAKYTLHVSGYSGDAGDSLSRHSRVPFSTFDRDNDANGSGNCASMYKGAWWYYACHDSNLNGRYYFNNEMELPSTGIQWVTFSGHTTSLMFAEMKVRRK